jgi:hypothetical protein
MVDDSWEGMMGTMLYWFLLRVDFLEELLLHAEEYRGLVEKIEGFPIREEETIQFVTVGSPSGRNEIACMNNVDDAVAMGS